MTDSPSSQITSPCWDEKPGDVLHCTESPGHKGDHYHCYEKAYWPNTAERRAAKAT